MNKRYPNRLSAGAKNVVIPLNELEVAKLFAGDTRSDIGSEVEKLKFANPDQPTSSQVFPARFWLRIWMAGYGKALSSWSTGPGNLSGGSWFFQFSKMNFCSCTKRVLFTAVFPGHRMQAANGSTRFFFWPIRESAWLMLVFQPSKSGRRRPFLPVCCSVAWRTRQFFRKLVLIWKKVWRQPYSLNPPWGFSNDSSRNSKKRNSPLEAMKPKRVFHFGFSAFKCSGPWCSQFHNPGSSSFTFSILKTYLWTFKLSIFIGFPWSGKHYFCQIQLCWTSIACLSLTRSGKIKKKTWKKLVLSLLLSFTVLTGSFAGENSILRSTKTMAKPIISNGLFINLGLGFPSIGRYRILFLHLNPGEVLVHNSVLNWETSGIFSKMKNSESVWKSVGFRLSWFCWSDSYGNNSYTSTTFDLRFVKFGRIDYAISPDMAIDASIDTTSNIGNCKLRYKYWWKRIYIYWLSCSTRCPVSLQILCCRVWYEFWFRFLYWWIERLQFQVHVQCSRPGSTQDLSFSQRFWVLEEVLFSDFSFAYSNLKIGFSIFPEILFNK